MERSILPVGVAPPKLTDDKLAQIGIATHYEAYAKTILTVVLKSLAGLSFADWVQLEKKQFGQIVDDVSSYITADNALYEYFEIIKRRHEELRESRNFVVHAIWGQSASGLARGYCYRRKKSADENDVVRAVNDSFWLATKVHELAFQVALKIEAGALSEGTEDLGFHMNASSRSVRF